MPLPENPTDLQSLLGYFHQDFHDCYGGVWETVDAFIADDPQAAVQVPTEIDRILRTVQSEPDLEAWVEEAGCEYLAQPEDNGYRGWLAAIARHIESKVGGTN